MGFVFKLYVCLFCLGRLFWFCVVWFSFCCGLCVTDFDAVGWLFLGGLFVAC